MMKDEDIIGAADQWHKDLLAVEKEKTARRRMTLNVLGAAFLATPILILLWPTLSVLNFTCFAEAVSFAGGFVSAVIAILMFAIGWDSKEHPNFVIGSVFLIVLAVFLSGIVASVPTNACP